MTVTATNASSGPYTGNGVQVAFPFTFRAETTAEAYLEVNGAQAPATITLTTDVNGNLTGGGTATAATPPASGAAVYVRLNPSFQQNIALTNNGAFSPSVIEQGFDRAAQRSIYLLGIYNTVSALATAASAAVAGAVTAAAAAAQAVINAAVFVVTSAAGQSVTTRTLLAGITAPTNGQTAYLAEAGREGWFKFSTANLSASVTADTTQAIYVAPSTATSGASGAWVRVEAATVAGVKATWFGWKGDGATNDTPAYQAAINYLAATGGGTLWIPPGHSMVNGALQDTSFGNAQILWPLVTDVSQTIAIRIKGAAPAPMSCDPVSGKNFTIIESNLNAAGWVFGGKSHTGFENRTCISVYMEDLIIRMPQDTAGSCLDFGYVHMHKLDNIRVDVPSASSCIKPTHAGSVGIRAPLDAVSAWSLWNNVLVAGFYRGLQIGELVVATHIHAAFCVYPLATQLGEHASIILSALVTNSPNTLLVDGGLQLNIGLLNIEHDQTAAHGGSGPDWVEPFGYDIYDIGGAGHGVINYQFHDDATIPFTVNDAHNFILKRVRPQNQSGYGLLYPGQTTVTNASSLEEIRGVFGGFPWLQFVQPSSTLTDQIGVLAFAGANPNTDTRNAQINVSYDGSLDAGKVVFTVWRGGTATTAFTIDSRGNVIPNALVAAANDTAAATANVPVGGFYQTSGAVKVRLT